jgi:hypothetical protein
VILNILTAMLKRKKETGEANFNKFELAYYIQNITVSTHHP